MAIKSQTIQKFLKLFDGYELAYGQHCNLVASDTGKMEGKGDTISHPLEESFVQSHLEGTGNSLGIIPLKLKNTLRFGAIDIDIKHPTNPLTHTIEQIQEKINKLGLPLVTCQSKSKGVHLYCFTQEEVNAKLLVNRLREWASLIGYGSVEIFPKQTSRADRKDIGNWLNMPYFNSDKTDRYCIDHELKKLTLEQFLKYATVSSISKQELENFSVQEQFDSSYDDAPPCLQSLATIGIEEGSRNNGLFNFAVYYHKKYPDSFEEKIMEANGNIIKPALRINEVEPIIKSVNKKEFFFKCSEYPIVQYCNKVECKKRRFGIGHSANATGETIDLDNLVKYIGDDGSARWYVEAQGKRIQLTTDELSSQALFKKRMMIALNHVWVQIKAIDWDNKIRSLMAKCETFHDPEDASPKGQFIQYLDFFLTDTPPGTNKDDIIRKRNVYFDESTNLMYFRSTKLFEYLKNKRFSYVESQAWAWFREIGGEPKQVKVSGKNVRVWCIAAPDAFLDENINKV